MPSASCPACGAELTLRAGLPYGVCQYCQSLLVRSDASLAAVGKVAAVPEDVSPLQLGASGTYEGARFTLIGRVRKAWEQGSWSEWCAQFDDQRIGWLAEAQGDYVMTFEVRVAPYSVPSVANMKKIRPGNAWLLQKKRFIVSDIKTVECIAAEGELARFDIGQREMLSIDLRGPGLEFATAEYTDDVAVFVGSFVELTECAFQGLRQLPGW
jgi:hypothetical protein